MGKIVGIKSGCYTLLHNGHVWAIQECAKQVDYLIILTNDNQYIERKKGCLPLTLEQRTYILENIKGVDEVGTFEGLNEHFWISEFRARRLKQEFGEDATLIVFHSSELQNEHWVPGKDIADKVIFIPKDLIRASVSDIFDIIRGKDGKKQVNYF